jgi:hypothetical protein
MQKLEYAIVQNIDKKALAILGAIGVVPGPAGAWDRRYVNAAGGFSTDTLVEDQDMTLTLLRSGKRVVYDNDAVAYTETPHSIKNFLKQRFRWIFGTTQCFWKHKRAVVENPLSVMSVIVLPNIFVFSMILPLTYPFVDSALVIGLILSDWHYLVLPFIIFTSFDIFYAGIGTAGEKEGVRLLMYVPLQRVLYRQLLYFTVMRSLVRAIEGTGSGWNKFAKMGETQRFYFANSALASMPQIIEPLRISRTAQSPHETPATLTRSLQGPEGTSEASTKAHDVIALSTIPKHDHTAGETSSPAASPYLFAEADSPKT